MGISTLWIRVNVAAKFELESISSLFNSWRSFCSMCLHMFRSCNTYGTKTLFKRGSILIILQQFRLQIKLLGSIIDWKSVKTAFQFISYVLAQALFLSPFSWNSSITSLILVKLFPVRYLVMRRRRFYQTFRSLRSQKITFNPTHENEENERKASPR